MSKGYINLIFLKDPNSEFYVKKYLVLLMGKLIKCQAIDFNSVLQKKLLVFMLSHLDTKSAEENEGVLEVISILGLSTKVYLQN